MHFNAYSTICLVFFVIFFTFYKLYVKFQHIKVVNLHNLRVSTTHYFSIFPLNYNHLQNYIKYFLRNFIIIKPPQNAPSVLKIKSLISAQPLFVINCNSSHKKENIQPDITVTLRSFFNFCILHPNGIYKSTLSRLPAIVEASPTISRFIRTILCSPGALLNKVIYTIRKILYQIQTCLRSLKRINTNAPIPISIKASKNEPFNAIEL